MKQQLSRQRKRGFTFWDLMICLAAVAILVVEGLQWVNRPRRGCRLRITCLSNLRQVGLAMRMWSGDHNDKFPWNVSTNDGGTMEFANSTNVFLHFRATSNELNSPKVLVCSADSARSKTNDFDNLSNANLSYFASLDADEGKPQRLLSGDRNISTKGALITGYLSLASNGPVRIAPGLHKNYAYLGLSDGSAQQVSETQWSEQLNRSDIFPVRLVLP